MAKKGSQIITEFLKQQQTLELKVQQADETQAIKNERKKVEAQRLKNSGVQQIEQDRASSFQETLQRAEQFKLMTDHFDDIPTLEKRYQTNIQTGLRSDQLHAKLLEHGRNTLSEKKKTPWYIKLLHELITPFALMLWVGSGLCFLAYGLTPLDPSNLYLGIVLAAVVLLNGIMTFFQNAKSEAIMESFKNFIPKSTLVIRDGTEKDIITSELFPGDIIIVKGGNQIPADIRIIQQNQMKVDNSSLTGESDQLPRSHECTNKENPLETRNLAFFGTQCVEGQCRALVIQTGDRTVIGQIANLAFSAGASESTLSKEIEIFIKKISIFAVVVGVIFFCLGFIVGYTAVTNLVFAIGIIVANVPEGMLGTITISLALSAKRLAGRKVLVKNMTAVETLGSTTCICSDKTGTLTQNKMTVMHLWYNGKKYEGANKEIRGPKYKYEYDEQDPGLIELHTSCILSSDSSFIYPANHNPSETPYFHLKTTGDASEAGLLKFWQPIKKLEEIRSQYELGKDHEGNDTKMPFNSNNKYAFSIRKYKTPTSDLCLFTKGAPERIWDLCTHVLLNGEIIPKTKEWDKKFKEINDYFGRNGERVLGFAKKHIERDHLPEKLDLQNPNFGFKEQVFVGLISLVDPPRDSVPDAIEKCKTAGIKVIMVTGDQPITATAIARKVKIFDDGAKTANEIAEEQGIPFEDAVAKSDAIVIHGDILTKLTQAEEGLPQSEKGKKLKNWLSKPQIVFARTSPAQKLIIVEANQNLGHIVAVTGDGVNDSPAIKKADIGVAMGITGSDVAKDAADMVLLNDDFSGIVIGIEEGRKIFDNIRRCIQYILTSNIPELVPFLAFIIFQFPLPLTTVLILCIDLGTDILPGIAFAYEESEMDIMLRKPRSQAVRLANLQLLLQAYVWVGWIQTFGCFVTYFVVLNDFGYTFGGLFYLQAKYGIIPNESDVFDISAANLGNSNLKLPCDIVYDQSKLQYDIRSYNAKSDLVQIDFLYNNHYRADLRHALPICDPKGTGRYIVNGDLWGQCKFQQISPVSERPVCYSTEAAHYAQTAFFLSEVVLQLSNFLICKTKKLSIYYQGLNNQFMPFAFMTEFWVTMGLVYVKGINVGLGLRDVMFIHYGVHAVPFGILILLYDEARKYLIRNLKPDFDRPNWWERATLI